MELQAAVDVRNLRRVYRTTIGVLRRRVKDVVAVDDISFSVEAGELFGLLGPNGAGKTTTVKMLTTLLIPTGGSARVLGRDVVREADSIRGLIGFIFGMLGVFVGLTWGVLLFHLDLSHTDLAALGLAVLITTFSTSGLGLLLGCISLVSIETMFINNTAYFLLLVFSGANIPLAQMPAWMQTVAWGLPLTRGIAASRQLIAGARLAEVLPLLGGEVLLGILYVLIGFSLFRWFEFQAKRRGTLEAF
jgi:ABC-type uncharacterized transport system permease subunit